MSDLDNLTKNQRYEIIDSLLKNRGIGFEKKNRGAHYILAYKLRRYDYWPASNKWQVTGSNKVRLGLNALFDEMGLI